MSAHASGASPSLSLGAKYSPPHLADVGMLLTVSNRPVDFLQIFKTVRYG